jgi:endonuclease/exonuclease/phosphatase family metal-dependent hydrolase
VSLSPATARVVTLNFWGTEAPLDRRLELATRQLTALAPDVVCLQEVRPLDGRSGRTTADVIGLALGMHVTYGVAMSWPDGAFGPGRPGGQEGLAILARWPVRARRVLRLPEIRSTEARILLSVQLDTPAGPIWFHTTHLHYRLDDGMARAAQVIAIDDALRACGRGNDDPPQVLCGDFNATVESDEMRFLRGLCAMAGRRTHFQDAWLRVHGDVVDARGVTWSSENEHTRPLRSLDIDRRIDYVLVTSRKKDGRGTVRGCEVVLTERAGDGADAICASDHYGVMADVQIGLS